MRSSLADYQLLGPLGAAGGPDGPWLATPPARLAGIASTVAVIAVPDPGQTGWHRFAARARSVAAVRHEHLSRLVEAGRSHEPDGPVAWITRLDAQARPVAEMAAGPAAALTAVAAAARAAHALHEAGWAHGDIGPATIITEGDQVLLEPPIRTLADQGMRTNDPVSLDRLEPAVIWGEGPSRTSDVWALAATAHFLVTGQLVHPALVDDPIVTAVQRALLEPPQLAPGLDGELGALLRACLTRDLGDRPPTAAVLADRLDSLGAPR